MSTDMSALPVGTERLIPLNSTSVDFLKTLTVWNLETEPTRIPLKNIQQWAIRINNIANYKENYESLITEKSEPDNKSQNQIEKLENEKADLILADKDNLDTIQQYKATIRRLERALDAAQSTDTINTIKRQKIREPDIFSGKRNEYETFKAKMITKLNGDSHLFTNDQHKLQYLVSFLKDEAYKMVKMYVKVDKIDLEDMNEMWEVLDGAYDDPDRKGTAERELRKLKQTNREFSTYLAEFQRLMAELQWDTPAKRVALLHGISEELKDLLLSYDEPENYNALTRLLQRLDSKLRTRAAEKNNRLLTPPRTAATSTPKSTIIPVSERRTDNPSYGGPAPMDLSAQQRTAEQQARYEQRRSEGACTACGSKEHWRRNCPRSRRPIHAAAATTTATASTPSNTNSTSIQSEN
jgi:hypothetical protein